MDVEAFIERWTRGEGGAERANYQLFLTELCDVIGVARPDPAGATHANNDYVFERAVRPRKSAPTVSPKRIDLYKRGVSTVRTSINGAARCDSFGAFGTAASGQPGHPVA